MKIFAGEKQARGRSPTTSRFWCANNHSDGGEDYVIGSGDFEITKGGLSREAAMDMVFKLNNFDSVVKALRSHNSDTVTKTLAHLETLRKRGMK